MKLQTIFNRVKKHLLKQNEKAMVDTLTGCKYRVPNSKLKCGVGCLIKKKYYSEILEGNTPDDIRVIGAVCASLGLNDKSPVLESFLYDMQKIHDKSAVTNWKPLLKKYEEDNIKFLKKSVH